MTWSSKCWGRVQHIFASPHAAVSCLEVTAGWRCSCHRHKHRANMFAVQEGRIVVEDWRDGFLGRKHVRLLGPGDVCSVPSGVWHRFRVLVSGRVIEVYWADGGEEVSADDIERRDEGGPDDRAGLVRELKEAGML